MAVNRSFAINSTYYTSVEEALYDAGELDLTVEFTKTDPDKAVPFIQEVTVKPEYGEDTVQKVAEALKPFMS